jgi:hypothetical protein
VLALCSSSFAQLGGKAAAGGKATFGGGGAGVTPDQISGIQAWFAADSGTSCGGACSNGNTLTQWNDKSVNADNLASGASCSTLPTFASSQINGKPAIKFNGSSQCIQLVSSITLTTASTVFAVIDDVSIAAKGSFFSGASGSLVYWSAPTKEQGADNAATVLLGNGTAAADTSWHQINETYNNTTVTFRLGRATDGSASPSSTLTAVNTIVGANASSGPGEWFNGYIAELIIYNRVLNGTEIGEVEAYLNGRYGL